ncbi:MAG TPA: hypothetical protein ENL06_01485 [Candidatus Portnoybacteria bacterium]|nr:hypothetical protein [Candidatus Portnoybacteria bacterium]
MISVEIGFDSNRRKNRGNYAIKNISFIFSLTGNPYLNFKSEARNSKFETMFRI